MQVTKDFYSENIVLLQKYQPDAWSIVDTYEVDSAGELFLADNGLPNLRMKNNSGDPVTLHDNTDPRQEVDQFYELVPVEATGVVTFLGMGLGYSPLAIIENRAKIRNLVVFELSIPIFIHALHALDLGPLLTDRRFMIVLGPTPDVTAVMAAMGKALQLESVYLLNHTPSALVYGEERFVQIQQEIFKGGNMFSVGGATTLTYGSQFIRNRLCNFSNIHHQQLLECLLNSMGDIPAILVSGGPSLDKNIHLLSKVQDKAVIIAVDSVVPALLAHNVRPDFITAIDMTDIVFEKVADVAALTPASSLVCASWVNPRVPRNFSAKHVFWTFTGGNMEKWLNTMLGGRISTAGAGTVAHLSLTVAGLLGCSPIIFIGQDLAFAEDRDHATHSYLTSARETKSFFDSDAIVRTEGYCGDQVPTNRAFLDMKHHFEKVIAATDGRLFINATEGGVRIDGTEQLSLEKTIELYCRDRVEIDEIIDTTVAAHKSISNSGRIIREIEVINREMVKVGKNLKQIDLLCQDIVKQITMLQKEGVVCRQFTDFSPDLQRKISKLDQVNELLDNSKVWYLLDEVTLEGLRDSDRLQQQIEVISGNPECYLEWLNLSIERFTLINRARKEVFNVFRRRIQRLLQHLKQERSLLRKISGKRVPSRIRHDLLELYFADEDYTELKAALESLPQAEEETGEKAFYMGTIALVQGQYQTAERQFSVAVNCREELTERINRFRQKLSEKYLSFSGYWRPYDLAVSLKLLLKGLRIYEAHPEIRQTISRQAVEDLSGLKDAASQGNVAGHEAILDVWCDQLNTISCLEEVIGNETAASFFFYRGTIFVGQENHEGAALALGKALTITPENPEYYLFLADTHFAQEDYAAGVTALDKAVQIDRGYARYWEVIGDNLLDKEQVQDALGAYERCFSATPAQAGLLKKIGDCYLRLGQTEAAREAYSILKQCLESVDSP